MPNYRRNYVPGGTYFFTLARHERRRFLTSGLGRACLHRAIEREQAKRPFELITVVLLPDHLHAVWTLPERDHDYSRRWASIKEAFTRNFLAGGGAEGRKSLSRARHRERAVWQRRSWEHTCRGEDDLKRFIDYVHWNPCKHGLVARPRDYPWSSFHRFEKLGEYDADWGATDPCPVRDDPEWE